jgi:hypothetical protein
LEERLELAVTDPTTDLPPFVAPPANGGVNAQVNLVSTHCYPTCNQQEVDATLFDRVLLMIQELTPRSLVNYSSSKRLIVCCRSYEENIYG